MKFKPEWRMMAGIEIERQCRKEGMNNKFELMRIYWMNDRIKHEWMIPEFHSVNSDSILAWFQFAFLELINWISWFGVKSINEIKSMKANESTSQNESVCFRK